MAGKPARVPLVREGFTLCSRHCSLHAVLSFTVLMNKYERWRGKIGPLHVRLHDQARDYTSNLRAACL